MPVEVVLPALIPSTPRTDDTDEVDNESSEYNDDGDDYFMLCHKFIPVMP